MPKTKISEFSATANSNTDINSINIAEGCAPSNINDAIRELMAELKDFQAGTKGDSFNGPVGTTTAAAGAFTTLSASSTVSGTGFSTYLASPPAIGGTAAAAGSFTTLTTSSTVTLNGGTANGVLYLNGSKVATSGSALTFDGTNLGVGTSSPADILHLSKAGDLYLRVANTSTAINAYLGQDSNGTFIGNTGASVVRFIQGASERMRIDTSGNLGIGTSSPSTRLQVNFSSATAYSSGATGNGLIIYNTSTTTNQYAGIVFQGEPTAGNAGQASIYGTTTGSGAMDLVFSTRGSSTLAERARITSAGAWSFGSSGTATGTSGQVLTSNGSGSAPSWQSAGGGAVTSVNGQTGAVDTTTFGNIGSYFIGFGATNTNYDTGSTIAGSSLNKYSVTSPTALGTADTSSAGFGYVNSFTSAGLTGTWRAMARFGNSTGTAGYAAAGLWVRIS